MALGRSKMNVLVTGGAGYIGSHVVRELIDRGHKVLVLDNLSGGHMEAVDPRAQLIVGSTADYELVTTRLKFHQIEAVMDFAAHIDGDESVTDPHKFYQNNFCNTLSLMNAMRKMGVKKFVFSSSAAVYGNPLFTPINENQTRAAIHPYGRSKLMTEMALEDFCSAYGMGFTILRYFNVAGASLDASLGEANHRESHLIPRILRAARDGKEVLIYGTDYPTPDGTCIRDFVHVVDLAHAHVLALEATKPGQGEVYNLGSEDGFSMIEVIEACKKITGCQIKMAVEPRLYGAPDVLVVSSHKIREKLGWNPLYPTMESIVQHAWRWHSIHPEGFGPAMVTAIPVIARIITPHLEQSFAQS